MQVFPLHHTSTNAFYRSAIDILDRASVPFAVGGAFAMRYYTGIERDTKDFDLMMRPRDVDAAIAAFKGAGMRADYAFRHWLAKIHQGEYFIDIVFRGGNGLCEVDDDWFVHAGQTEIFERKVLVCPPEEIIWQKAYIMERERFDGADINHMLKSCASRLDWDRLIARFGPDWRVLLTHLVMFGFVYPSDKSVIPESVLAALSQKLATDREAIPAERDLCRGPLVSRAQYLTDVGHWSYADARLADPRVKMTPDELEDWTNAIDRDQRPH